MAFKIFLDQTVVRIIDTSGNDEPVQLNPGQTKYQIQGGIFKFFDNVSTVTFPRGNYQVFQDELGNSFASENDFIVYLNSFINLNVSGTTKDPSGSSDIDQNGRFGANTVFGDRVIGTRHSTIAAQFQYGLQSSDADPVVDNGGIVDFFESMLRISSGVNVAGSAMIQSTATVRYTPGQEVYCFFTAVFSPPKADSYQRVGLFDDDNGFFVGYEGTQFSFVRRRNGVDNITAINLSDFAIENKYILDPLKGNIYKISYGYLGFAPITLEVMTPDGGYAVLAKISYPNSATETHTTQTFLPVRGEVGNTGNDTNLTVLSGSLAAGITNGDDSGTDATSRAFAWANEVEFTVSGDTELVAFRNKDIFNGITNYVNARLILISGANELNKNPRWKLLRNPAILNTPTWNDVKTGDSVLEYSLDALIDFALSDDLYMAWNKFKTGDFFEKVEEFVLDLPPGATAIFIIESEAAATGTADLSIRWKELF